MPIGTLTTAWAVAKLWAGVELVANAALEKAGQDIAGPVGEEFGSWISHKFGLNDKKRETVFLEAYHKAEQKLIDKIGLAPAYRVFRFIPSLVDTVSIPLILDMLEDQSVRQKRIGSSKQKQTVPIREEDNQNLIKLMYYLRQSLYETTIYRPLIEFYASEDAMRVRDLIGQEMEQLSGTIDDGLRAVRVTLVESVDFEKERQTYLDQVKRFFEEQDFLGFPELKEQKRATLLKDIYVLLQLKYKDGGESLNDELGQLVVTQLNKEE